jgi:hypothetical protein
VTDLVLLRESNSWRDVGQVVIPPRGLKLNAESACLSGASSGRSYAVGEYFYT